AQTLSDKEYQHMRDAAVRIIRAIGVETGGSNIQFAVNPTNGEMVGIEMNPRVSRSSALASKATGFPIAKIAAKLAVGYTLDEIRNDITRVTPASFEPTIDYCVVKMPRFAFEKFPETDPTLTTQMKSVGEAMAIGRTFKEALQKALRSLETGHHGFEPPRFEARTAAEIDAILQAKLRTPHADRPWYIAEALRRGMAVETVAQLTHIDPWFIANIQQIVAYEDEIQQAGSLPPRERAGGEGPSGSRAKAPHPNPLPAGEGTEATSHDPLDHALTALSPATLARAKQYGFSDARIATLLAPGN